MSTRNITAIGQAPIITRANTISNVVIHASMFGTSYSEACFCYEKRTGLVQPDALFGYFLVTVTNSSRFASISET